MTHGHVVSASRVSVLEELGQRGLITIELREAGHATTPRSLVPNVRTVWDLISLGLGDREPRLGRRALLDFTDSLAALLRAGLTAERALQICATLGPAQRGRGVARKLLDDIRSGSTLCDAFADSRERLPPYYTSMIEAGEAGGSLPETLTRLADLMRRQLQIQDRVQSALFYPAILAAVVLLTLIMLLTFVLPRFEELFSESEAPLPWSTYAVLAVARFVANDWWIIAGAACLAATTGLLWLRTPHGRLQFDRWALRSRITFGLPGAINSARFLRTLSTLSRNGLPLPAALKIARGTLINCCLFEALGEVIRSVQAGEPLSQPLARACVFPPIVIQLVRVGEETGQLGELMESAAMALEEDSHRSLERLLTMLVPLVTIVMGLIVAGLISSVLIGLLSINDLAF